MRVIVAALPNATPTGYATVADLVADPSFEQEPSVTVCHSPILESFGTPLDLRLRMWLSESIEHRL